jgi:prepilin-type N-terminal cleavage/methylation domain-containing protein
MRRKLRGFTLVELLVVIGIIAVLISLLLPALNKARFAAGQIQCLSNEKQLMTAIAMYANANSGFLPRFSNQVYGTSNSVASPAWANGAWEVLIMPYLNESVGPFQCPLRQVINSNVYGKWYESAGSIYKPTRVMYQVNGMEPVATVSRPFGPVYQKINGVSTDVGQTMRFSSVAPSTIMICDSVYGSSENSMAYLAQSFSGTTPSYPFTGYDGVRSVAISSHNNVSASIGFFDQHAETVLRSEFLRDVRYAAPGSIDIGDNEGCLGDIYYGYNNGNIHGIWDPALNY